MSIKLIDLYNEIVDNNLVDPNNDVLTRLTKSEKQTLEYALNLYGYTVLSQSVADSAQINIFGGENCHCYDNDSDSDNELEVLYYDIVDEIGIIVDSDVDKLDKIKKLKDLFNYVREL